MKLGVLEDRTVEIKEVYNPIKLTTASGEVLFICMRDSGFEFNYEGRIYEAKGGDVRPLEPSGLPAEAEEQLPQAAG